jgi:hypothetical protein
LTLLVGQALPRQDDALADRCAFSVMLARTRVGFGSLERIFVFATPAKIFRRKASPERFMRLGRSIRAKSRLQESRESIVMAISLD